MSIDMASVYAERFKSNPNMLRAAVLGQSPDPKLDPYTALNALRLVKESQQMAMAGQAQQPTSAPSILAQNLAPPTPPQGLAGMMPMGAPAGQMPQQRAPAPAPQAPVMQASGGLAGLPTPEQDYADGGIVAFQSGGLNTGALTLPPGTPYDEDETGTYVNDSTGNASTSALSRAQDRLDEYMNFTPKEMSTKEQEAFLDRYMERVKKAGGPDIYAPAREDLRSRKEALTGDRRSGEGMALLTAAGAILKGRNLAEGASNALPAFAQQLGEVRRAEQQEKRAIAQMNFALDDAQRKERMGDARGAQAALAEARKFQQDANRAEGDKLRYGADIAARTVQYSRPAKGAGAGGSKLAERLADAEEAYAMDPTAENKARLNALSSAAAKMKTSFSTSENAPNKQAAVLAPVQARIDAKVADSMKSFPTMNPAYRKAMREGNQEEAKRLWGIEEAKWRGIHSKAEAAASGEGGGSKTPGVIKLD